MFVTLFKSQCDGALHLALALILRSTKPAIGLASLSHEGEQSGSNTHLAPEEARSQEYAECLRRISGLTEPTCCPREAIPEVYGYHHDVYLPYHDRFHVDVAYSDREMTCRRALYIICTMSDLFIVIILE